MYSLDNFGIWILALAGMFSLVFFLANRVSSPKRDWRRRRKNYGRVLSRTKRPVVMLSVRTARN